MGSLYVVEDSFILERILLFCVGVVFVVGGVVFCKQSLAQAKNLIQCIAFSLLGFMAGMLFICWALGGPPE